MADCAAAYGRQAPPHASIPVALQPFVQQTRGHPWAWMCATSSNYLMSHGYPLFDGKSFYDYPSCQPDSTFPVPHYWRDMKKQQQQQSVQARSICSANASNPVQPPPHDAQYDPSDLYSLAGTNIQTDPPGRQLQNQNIIDDNVAMTLGCSGGIRLDNSQFPGRSASLCWCALLLLASKHPLHLILKIPNQKSNHK